ncbi:6-bladed beta-propeller [Parabacteroides sp. PF5-9]|uniref:6-bladed beta-propeller n=1 Tax=Parabacteroides sp. PF5-9 TaxID=1742404 RepID=UPI0024743A21|nr:6-bladed beta-propeller [Parabacteroides sp. PF5-9]MDH6359006.1 hypothetical protein [Parabacteroides sp. PF5-9]
MKKIFFYSLFVVYAFLSCDKTNINNDTIFITLSSEKSTLTLTDLFESCRFVSLETNDTLLLDKIENFSKILTYDNCIYIGELKTISVFDANGKFVKKINRYGEGADTYLSLYNFMIWKDGTISINDRLSQSIVSYSNDGVFLDRFRLKDISILDITYLNDTLLVAKADYNNKFKFYIFNRNTYELIDSYWPVSRRRFTYGMHDCFPRYEGKLLFNEPQNNLIYEITKDSAAVRYIVDIDGKTPPVGFWEQQNMTGYELNNERLKEGYIDNINFYAEGSISILLQFNGGTGVHEHYALIDKSNLKPVLFNEIVFDPGFKWKPLKMYALEDGWIVIPIPAYILYEQASEDFLLRFPDLKEDDNPILCIAKIK